MITAAGAATAVAMLVILCDTVVEREDRKMKATDLAVLIVALAGTAAYAADGERISTLQEQEQVSVTIYNEDLALVKDSRRVTLETGENALAWRDVSAHIRPETALLHGLSDASSFRLIEQNFDFDLLTPQKLLEKYVGGKVRVIRTNPASGIESSEEATVLSANEGVVLKYPDRIESLPAAQLARLAFQAVPGNLRDRPTLVIRLAAAKAGEQVLELSYLTSGLGWKADYVAELSPKDDRLDLNGWVTLTNQSGTTYRDARLQLVAGDVNRVQDELRRSEPAMAKMAMATAAPRMAEEALFEYHLYSLDRLTTIAENQTKQVALLSAAHVPATKEFLLRGADTYYRSSFGEIGQKMKVGVFVEFTNKGHDLGIPLPRGTIRVYKKDASGNAQFVGEDRIDHTPKNETVRLKLGDAFDITADKRQTDYQKIGGGSTISGSASRYKNVNEMAFELVLKNAKPEAVTVTVMEPIPGDWEILAENLPHAKAAANTAVWKVTVPAESKATLNYRVRVKY
jgi:hypothetical protein